MPFTPAPALKSTYKRRQPKANANPSPLKAANAKLQETVERLEEEKAQLAESLKRADEASTSLRAEIAELKKPKAAAKKTTKKSKAK